MIIVLGTPAISDCLKIINQVLARGKVKTSKNNDKIVIPLSFFTGVVK